MQADTSRAISTAGSTTTQPLLDRDTLGRCRPGWAASPVGNLPGPFRIHHETQPCCNRRRDPRLGDEFGRQTRCFRDSGEGMLRRQRDHTTRGGRVGKAIASPAENATVR